MIVVQFLDNNQRVAIADLKKRHERNLTLELEPYLITDKGMDINRVAVLIWQLLRRNEVSCKEALFVLTDPVMTEHRIEEVKRISHLLGITQRGIRHADGEIPAEQVLADYEEKIRIFQKKKKEIAKELGLSFIDRLLGRYGDYLSEFEPYQEPQIFHVEKYLFWKDSGKELKIDEMDEEPLRDLLESLQELSEHFSSYCDGIENCRFGNWNFERPNQGTFKMTADELNTIKYFVSEALDIYSNAVTETTEEYLLSDLDFSWNNLKKCPLPEKDGVYLFTAKRIRNGSNETFVFAGELLHSSSFLNGWRISDRFLQNSYEELKSSIAGEQYRIIAWSNMPRPFED